MRASSNGLGDRYMFHSLALDLDRDQVFGMSGWTQSQIRGQTEGVSYRTLNFCFEPVCATSPLFNLLPIGAESTAAL
jgi:hypothetical protein